MRTLPFVRQIRINHWYLYRDIKKKREYQQIEKALSAYLEILNSETLSSLINNRLLQSQINEETISAITWELYGIREDIERLTTNIEYQKKVCKIKIPLGQQQIRKIDTLKNLEYLDLRIYPEKKYRTLKDHSIIKCNFSNGEHILHSEDKQFNTLVDLVINLSEKTQQHNNDIIRILEVIESFQTHQKKKLEKLEQNFDYLKTQELELERKIQTLVNKINIEKLPTKTEIEKLVKIIIHKPKEIELKTTNIVAKITQQVDVITSDSRELKKTGAELKEITLS